MTVITKLNIAAAFLWLSLTAGAQADLISTDEITASYIFNIARNIEWPHLPSENENTSVFRIGLHGETSPSLLAALQAISLSKKLHGAEISVRNAANVKSLVDFDLVYIGEGSINLPSIYKAINGSPVLLVTSKSTTPNWVMINLVTELNRMRFEVNKSNLLNHGLKPKPELILNGGSEIDVAKLYRDGQVSLASLQGQLQDREEMLIALTKAVAQQENKNQLLEKELNKLTAAIRDSNQRLSEQGVELENKRLDLEESEKLRTGLESEIALNKHELTIQQDLLSTITSKIEARETMLQNLNKVIAGQEAEIANQRASITSLDELVGNQKTALNNLWISVAMGVLLIITVVAGYLVKRNDNKRLAAHGHDLQIARDRLVIAKKKADDASKAKGNFLSQMSHELRTPLQAIIGYSEIVKDDLASDNDHRHASDLSRVIQNAERLLKMINSVLNIAKIEAGKAELELTEVKLLSLANEAVSVIKPLLEKSNMNLTVDIKESSALPLSDPDKLLHILINLIGNACKYAPNSSLVIRAVESDQRMILSVSDKGQGLTEEQQKQIFEPYCQAGNKHNDPMLGIGLGLSITRQFCEMMGGTISVVSEPGQGATFIVNLPRVTQVLDQDILPVKMGADTQVRVESPNLVMIDDDAEFLDIMARTMRAEGFNVHTANDAETGYQLIDSIKPDVITLDLVLPDMLGWILYDRIKSSPELEHIPIIVISGRDSTKQEMQIKAEDYLTKPIRRDVLIHAAKRLANAL